MFLSEPLEEIEWLSTRFIEVQRKIVYAKVTHFCLFGEYQEQIPALLNHYRAHRNFDDHDFPDHDFADHDVASASKRDTLGSDDSKNGGSFHGMFLHYDILAGNLDRANQTLAAQVFAAIEEETPPTTALRGTVAFLQGDNDKALTYFDRSLKDLRKQTDKKKVLFGVRETLFYVLALFKINDWSNHSKIHSLLTRATEVHSKHSAVFTALNTVLLKVQGKTKSQLAGQAGLSLGFYRFLDPLSRAIGMLATYWVDPEAVDRETYQKEFQHYQTLLPVVAKIFAEILYATESDPMRQQGDHQTHAQTDSQIDSQAHHTNTHPQQDYQAYIKQETLKDVIRFTYCVRMGEHWERALNSLDHFFGQHGVGSVSQLKKRLIWHFTPTNKQLEVHEQTYLKGGWGNRRPVALKRLFEADPKLDYLTEDDKRTIATLKQERFGWYQQREYMWGT